MAVASAVEFENKQQTVNLSTCTPTAAGDSRLAYHQAVEHKHSHGIAEVYFAEALEDWHAHGECADRRCGGLTGVEAQP